MMQAALSREKSVLSWYREPSVMLASINALRAASIQLFASIF
jgi:hypothetical protein